jgi:hypothetical protein
MYYLKGVHRDRPGVEEIVWDSTDEANPGYGLRELDDVLWKMMLID